MTVMRMCAAVTLLVGLLSGSALGARSLLSSENANPMGANATEGCMSLAGLLTASGQFPTLLAAVDALGLTDALSDENYVATVFVPTEDAFAALLDALGITADDLLADTDTLGQVVTYHIVPERLLSTDLMDGMTLPTVQGNNLTVDLSDGVQIVGVGSTATVIDADKESCEGVAHVVDTVLLPTSS